MKSMESSTEVQEKRLWEEWDGFEFEGLETTAGTKMWWLVIVNGFDAQQSMHGITGR